MYSKISQRVGLIILLAFAFLIPTTSMAAEPSYGTATVDGDNSEWDLTNDFFSNMYRNGDINDLNPSRLYLRYDYNTNTLYALVLAVNEVLDNDVAFDQDNFIAIDGTTLITGDDANLSYIMSGSDRIGWEAAISLLPRASSYALNAGTFIFLDPISVAGNEISLEIPITNSGIFDDMEHGDPFANGWFTFGGTVGGGGISANSTDLPPSDGGLYSLETGWGSGGAAGYYGGFGRTYLFDLTDVTHFSFWINPDPGQDYTLEINLQDDDNSDNTISPADDDEFQYNLVVSPSGPGAISGGGWQLISIPLSDFYDDNSYLFGGNSVLDAAPISATGNGPLINVVFAVIGNSGSDATFRTDYWVFNNPTPQGSFDIYTVETKTGDVLRATFIDDADEYNPSFAPDSIHIVHDVVTSTSHDLYITNISTGVSEALAGGEGGNDAAWSPDSLYIAFDRVPAGDPGLYVVPSSGGIPTLVKENAVDPQWSNNSKRIAFVNTDRSLGTIAIDGSSETNLGVFGSNPSWSGNGKDIAYSDGNNIFIIKVNKKGQPDGSAVQVTFDAPGTNNQQPSWPQNNKTIVFHKASGNQDIWTVPASGGTQQMLAGSASFADYDPSYSINGKLVAYAGWTEPGVYAIQSDFNSNNVSLEKTIPTGFNLDQNYPNPFNPATKISFDLPRDAQVSLKIYDMSGRLIRTLVNGALNAGEFSLHWNGTDESGVKVASGMYLYRIKAGNFVLTKKMILMK